MKINNPEIQEIEKELRILSRRLDAGNCISCSENEVNNLMSGHATDLIDTVYIFTQSEGKNYVRIYGVVAQERKTRRYVWVYVYHYYRLWKCHRIEDAYEIVQKVKDKVRLEEKISKLTRVINNKQNRLQISSN